MIGILTTSENITSPQQKLNNHSKIHLLSLLRVIVVERCPWEDLERDW